MIPRIVKVSVRVISLNRGQGKGYNCFIIQLLRQGLSHNSVHACATVPFGVVGCDDLALLGWGSRGFARRKEKVWIHIRGFFRFYRWDTLNFNQATVKPSLLIITFDIVAFAFTLLWDNLSRNSCTLNEKNGSCFCLFTDGKQHKVHELRGLPVTLSVLTSYDYCIICIYDFTGAYFENSPYTFGQSEKS